MRQQHPGLIVQHPLFVSHRFRHARQAFVETGIDSFLKLWQQIEPDPVAQQRGVAVRAIEPIVELLVREITLDLASGAFDERANQYRTSFNFFQSCNGGHGAQASPAASPEKAHQKRLRLIVARMAECDLPEVSFFGDGGKKIPPRLSRHLFEIAFAAIRFNSLELELLQMEGHGEAVGHVGDKARVLARLLAANAVLEMGHFKPQAEFVFQLPQNVQQRDRIGPAGYAG